MTAAAVTFLLQIRACTEFETALRGSRALLLIPALLVWGCSTIQYYSQSITGQLDLMRGARPVRQVLSDPSTPGGIRQGLELVQEAREFARNVMLLSDNGSYRTYVALQRRFVVWNVFAAPEFSLSPVVWCFPIAGCLNYRGYFHEAQARHFASSLEHTGMDVYVGGVSAYSTLGWFRDPVLNTMLQKSPAELMKLLLHELAHQKLYITGDPDFNEAFAEAVATIGVERWLVGRPPAEADRFRKDQARDDAVYTLILGAKDELEGIYRSGFDANVKRTGKHAVAQDLHQRYQEMRRGWQPSGIYDDWFGGEINNARLAAISTYRELVPEFLRVFDASGKNLDLFYALANQLRNCSAAARRRWLQLARIEDGC